MPDGSRFQQLWREQARLDRQAARRARFISAMASTGRPTIALTFILLAALVAFNLTRFLGAYL